MERYGTEVQILFSNGTAQASVYRKLFPVTLGEPPIEQSLISQVERLVQDHCLQKEKIAKNAKFYIKPGPGSSFPRGRE